MNITELIKNEPVRALSWKEPFASLMLKGKIETRTWSANYRGWVLICASKKSYTYDQVYNISGDHQCSRILDTISQKWYLELSSHGKAIAIGRLVDCRPMKKEDEDKCFVKYYPDLFCHIYEDVHAIEPIDWQGSHGWRMVVPELFPKINLKQ